MRLHEVFGPSRVILPRKVTTFSSKPFSMITSSVILTGSTNIDGLHLVSEHYIYLLQYPCQITYCNNFRSRLHTVSQYDTPQFTFPRFGQIQLHAHVSQVVFRKLFCCNTSRICQPRACIISIVLSAIIDAQQIFVDLIQKVPSVLCLKINQALSFVCMRILAAC